MRSAGHERPAVGGGLCGVLATAALFALGGCVHRADGTLKSTGTHAEVRRFSYSDGAGLTVQTVAAQAQQSVGPRVFVDLGATADHVVNEPPPKPTPKPVDPSQPTGHLHTGGTVDIVSSASILASDQPVRTEEWRVEGRLGSRLELGTPTDPRTLDGSIRASTESDYRSLSASIGGSAEFFDRNTTVSGFLTAGHDVLLPLEAPPGEIGQWPASHDRVGAGAAVSQLLFPTLTLSGGAAVIHQWGRLSNPYRRALVQTSLFPERHPGTRLRLTAFAEAAWYLGGGAALHLRQGAYADTWGVTALIPEGALVKEIGEQILVSLRYRHYAQEAASFYAPRYTQLQDVMTGDPRLGELRDNVFGVEIRLTPWGRYGWARSVTILGGYDLSLLEFLRLGSHVRAQVFSFGCAGGF